MHACQACGYANAVEVYACMRCGAALSPAPMAMQGGYYPPVRTKSSVMPALLITGGVIAFLAVVIFGILVVIGMRVEAKQKAEASRKQAQIAAIQQERDQESRLNRAMKKDIEATKPTTDADFNRISKRIEAYVADARQVDLSGCPSDYADAYNRYLAAWSEEAVAVREHPHIPTEGEAVVNGFLNGLKGDSSGGTDDLKAQFKTWVDDLKARDAEVQKRADELNALAKQYGV